MSAGWRLWAPVAALLAALTIFAAFRYVPPLAGLEGRARDLVHALYHPAAETRDDILLVLIEERTLAQLPYRSPIDRLFLAELIGSLRDRGARAIALDLLIDQPTEPDKDEALRQAALGPGAPVVLATADALDGLLPAQEEALADFTEGIAVGQAALLRDPYNFVTRAAPETREVLGRAAPTMAAALARAGGVEAGDEGFEIAFTSSPQGADFAPRLLAAFHPYFAEADVEGRFVLVGVDLEGQDRHRTPLQALAEEDSRPGVESHAQALAQILDGRELREASWPFELGLTLTAALAVTGALMLPLPVTARAGAALALGAIFAATPAFAMSFAALRLPVAPPLIAAALVSGGVILTRWRAEALTRRRLRAAFSRYVSPAIVRRIERRPEALRLGGEKREITCVFTDVADFTTLCESLEAEELVTLLNGYLGGASKVFVEHGGTIDKFVGDAIVGFFGAPLRQEDHAAAAIRMAVALDVFAEAFAAREWEEGRGFGVTRIGVHTGLATVGNFGGDVFFDYTAMGDTVNVAARLEGANKAYGGRVTISGAALAAAGGAVEGVRTRPIGRLVVKGRAEGIETFEAYASNDPRAATEEAYAKAYAMMAAGEDATPAFRALAAEAPGDRLIALHAARAEAGERGVLVTLKEK